MHQYLCELFLWIIEETGNASVYIYNASGTILHMIRIQHAILLIVRYCFRLGTHEGLFSGHYKIWSARKVVSRFTFYTRQ